MAAEDAGESRPAQRGGDVVWLASYPKSGNTWIRAILTALATHRHLFGLDHLDAGSQPNHVGIATARLGIDPRWLDRDELDRLRTELIRGGSAEWLSRDGLGQPVFRKTHEVFRGAAPGREPFPADATRAAILVVRDPRDVACSAAPFFGITVDEAIERMGCGFPGGRLGSPATSQTEQPWGTWSSHGRSWLASDVPFPVHRIRYEDLRSDATETLLPVLTAVGVDCTAEELRAAVELTRFERLAEQEAEAGFREMSRVTSTFFRRGVAGGWRDELTDGQVLAIEADHEDVMREFGYEPVTEESDRRDKAAVATQRRDREAAWLRLPEWMGIDVRQGEIPASLPEARRPRRWIQVTSTRVLVRFAGGSGLLVEDGRRAVVQLPPEESLDRDTDPAWIVQGWAVTLAMLQRGSLSLHAATVVIGDEVVAIAGDRGAGKSTTSMALRARGHSLLVDDVTLVEFDDGAATATPFARNVHLLEDSADALGLDFDSLPLLAGGRAKVAFRPEDPPPGSRRIDRIVVLDPRPDAEAVEVREALGAERFAALMAHTARDGVAPLVLGQQRYFELLTALAAAVPVWIVTRPAGAWTLEGVVDRIEGLSRPAADSVSASAR